MACLNPPGSDIRHRPNHPYRALSDHHPHLPRFFPPVKDLNYYCSVVGETIGRLVIQIGSEYLGIVVLHPECAVTLCGSSSTASVISERVGSPWGPPATTCLASVDHIETPLIIPIELESAFSMRGQFST